MYAKVASLDRCQMIEAGYSREDIHQVTRMSGTTCTPSRLLLPGISSIEESFCMRLNRHGPVIRDGEGVVIDLVQWSVCCERQVKDLFSGKPGSMQRLTTKWAVLSEMPLFKQQVTDVTCSKARRSYLVCSMIQLLNT
jgi:hypothetical protein